MTVTKEKSPTHESNLVNVNHHAFWWYRDGRRMSGEGPAPDQYTLARQTGVSRSYISDIEQGTRKPRPVVAMALARALGVTVEDLMDDDPRFEQQRWLVDTRAANIWRQRQRTKMRGSLKSST